MSPGSSPEDVADTYVKIGMRLTYAHRSPRVDCTVYSVEGVRIGDLLAVARALLSQEGVEGSDISTIDLVARIAFS